MVLRAPAVAPVDTGLSEADEAAILATVGVYEAMAGPVEGLVLCCPDVDTGIACADRPARAAWMEEVEGGEVLASALLRSHRFADPGSPDLAHVLLGAPSGDPRTLRVWSLVRRPARTSADEEPVWNVLVVPEPGGLVQPWTRLPELGRALLPGGAPRPVVEWGMGTVALARCVGEAMGRADADRFVAELAAASAERRELWQQGWKSQVGEPPPQVQ